MKARFGTLHIRFETLILWILAIFLFDGIVRFISSILGIYILNAWKELFILMLILVSGFYIFAISKRVYMRTIILMMAIFAVFWSAIGVMRQGLIQTLWGIKIILLPPILFALVFQYWKPGIITIRRFYRFMIVAFLPIVFLGILQFVTGFEILKAIGGAVEYSYIQVGTFMGIPRAIGTFRKPFAFGDFCFMITMISTGFLFRSVTPGKRWRYLLIALLGIIGVYVSTSRASMLMTLFGFFVWIVLRWVRWKDVRNFTLFVISFLTPVAVLILAIFVIGRNVELPFISTYSTFARLYLWGKALTDFPLFQSPLRFFFGYGIGAIGTAQLYSTSPLVTYNPVDNLFLWSLVQFGVVGSAMFFTIVLYPFVSALRSMPADWYRHQNWVYVAIAIVIAFSIVFAEGMYRLFFEGFPLPYLYWFLHFAILFNLRKIKGYAVHSGFYHQSAEITF